MYLVISDVHIGDHHANKNLPKLFSLLEQFANKDVSLILNGDIFDFAKFLGFDERHRKFISIISNFKEVIYVEGNHDWFLSGLQSIFGVRFVKELVLNVKNNIIRIFHGHQEDFICHKLSRLTRFLIKMNSLVEKLTGFDAQNWLWNTKFMKKILGRQERNIIKREKVANVVIVGHTHKCCIKADRIMYYNTGDWISGNCAYIIIDEDIQFTKVS